MRNKLVPVYEALTMHDAQLLADRLNDAGIESFVDQTDSPIEGVIAGPQAKIVRVYRRDEPEARPIVADFEREEGAVGAHGEDEQQREPTGLELSSEQRPRDDSPSHDVRGEGVDRRNEPNPADEAPEVADLIDHTQRMNRREVDGARIKGFGADRPLAQEPDVESQEIEEQPIERLDVSRVIDEPETGTPAANLRGPAPRAEARGGAKRPGPQGGKPSAKGSRSRRNQPRK